MKNKYIKVLIEWEDIISDSSWSDIPSSSKPILCFSMGYIEDEILSNISKRTFINIHHTINAHDQGDCTSIPIGCIKIIHLLNKGKKVYGGLPERSIGGDC